MCTAVDAIRQALRIMPVDRTFRSVRDKAQRAGVYSILMGDLGNYKTQVAPEEFRGIAIAHPIAPLVVINSYDTQAAMLCTLVHELAHIFLGSSGISNQNVFESRSLHQPIEQFCNSVAAEFLVPDETLRSSWNEHQREDLEISIARLARIFGVSSEVITRRLFDLRRIKEEDYQRLIALYQARWESNKKRHIRGGPNANSARYNLGRKTLSTISRAVDEGLITLLDAARALNMSVFRFEKIARDDI